uniref:Uncharacterized protein n=1 Tax=viral metagenome TaxID=1070528 RepID=A0A6M3L3V7_9ZZZZ
MTKWPDDMRVINCASCGKMAASMSEYRRAKENDLPHICGHIKGRPWCNICIQTGPPAGAGNTDPAAVSDMNYHGGRFHSGEW